MKREGKRSGKWESKNEGIWLRIGKGALASIVSILGLLAIGAALIVSGVLTQRHMDGWVIACCGIGVFFGVCIPRKRGGGGGMLGPIGVGVGTATILTVSGFFLYSEINPQRFGAVVLACLCGGGLAGVLCRRQPKRRRG